MYLMETNIILYGVGGHAKVVLDCIESQNKYKVAKILDDNKNITKFKGRNVYHPEIDEIFTLPIIISIGNNEVRKKISLKHPFKSPIIIHKEAFVSASATIGAGSVIMPKAVVNADSKIGKHCIINTSAVVEHDCEIENYVHISPNATISGNVKIDEGTWIGAGAVAKNNISIGKWATIGAGAVVVKDVPDYAVVVGNPARIIKYNSLDFI